jgi:hypothetical protein
MLIINLFKLFKLFKLYKSINSNITKMGLMVGRGGSGGLFVGKAFKFFGFNTPLKEEINLLVPLVLWLEEVMVMVMVAEQAS